VFFGKNAREGLGKKVLKFVNVGFHAINVFYKQGTDTYQFLKQLDWLLIVK